MSKQTIEEAKTKAAVLEKEIMRAIANFENETGTIVEGVQVDRLKLERLGAKPTNRITGVHLEIHLNQKPKQKDEE